MLNRLSPNTRVDIEPPERGFDLASVIGFFWRQWKFIAAIMAVATIAGTLQLIRSTPIYVASAQVLLDPLRAKGIGDDTLFTQPIMNPIISSESEAAVIRSTALLHRVVERENLVRPGDLEAGANETTTSKPAPVAPGKQENSFIGKLRSMFPGRPRDREPYASVYPASVIAAIAKLRGATEVTRVPQTFVVNISFSSPDPVRAARMANAIADAYILDKLDTRFEAAQRATAWLNDRLEQLRKQVRDSEAAVTKFRADHSLLAGNASATLNQQQLADLNGKLVAARTELAEKKARLDLLEQVQGKGGNLQSLLPDLVKDNQTIGILRAQLAANAQKEADLLARYGDRHPLVINARAERRDLERRIAAEIQKLSGNVKNEYEIAKARVASLEESLREVTGQGNLDSGTVVTLRDLERTAAVNKALFDEFLKKSKSTQEQSTFEPRDARVITPALPPSAPTYPSKPKTMLLFMTIGLFLGTAGALAKESLNSGFTTPQQIEDAVGLPLLSSVSRTDPAEVNVQGKSISLPEYIAVKPLSRYSEAIRTLRSGIQMTDVDNPPKVVQVTSTVPNEGKTTIAMALAASAAGSGLRVLVIDGDLRRPSASKILGDGDGEHSPGLVDLLVGSASLEQVVRYNETVKLWFIKAGSKTQNPPDLLNSDRMKAIVGHFKNSFDFVVIDTPPVGPVIDPVIVSQLVDKVVFVVRWAATGRELVERVLDNPSFRKNIAGIVFNHVIDHEARKYGKYAYSYYYGARQYKSYYTS